MKFKEYLNENQSKEEIKSILEKDCKPFLKNWDVLGVGLFYTGRREKISSIINKKVRKNRAPRDNPKEIHELLDDWFYKKFGVRSRSNVVFATRNAGVALDYGPPYLIFPIGNYISVSSDKIEDLYNEIREIFFDLFKHQLNDYRLNSLSNEDMERFKDKIIDMLKSSNYKKGLQRHINEQMITCKEYYLVNIKYENYLYNELEM
jgi:hypothetical protein